MERNLKQELKYFVSERECPKGFRCLEKGIKDFCRTKKVAIEDFLICLEENSEKCKYVVSFGIFHFCQCPERYYIKNKLDK